MTGSLTGKKWNWIMLAGFVLACEAVGAISSWLTAPEIAGWYAALTKPSFNPPNWVFAPVWTALFALMGIAAWLVWRTPTSALRSVSLRCFWLQLCVNFLWSMMFFRQHSILEAAVVILFLLVFIAAIAYFFALMSRAAALLMVPYACWVGFAAALNWAVWRLNR